MVFATVKGICALSFAVLTASLLLACAKQGAPEASGLKIRTVRRYSGSAAEKDHLDETIVYLQRDRRRTEERRQQRNALWPGGPPVIFYEPHSAMIENCDGDARRALILNLDNRTYAPFDLGRKLTAEEIKTLNNRVPNAETPTRATVLHEITTRDTGERKKAFGSFARRVTSRFKIVRLDGKESKPWESVTDGWYIDLNTNIPCEPVRPAPREGTTYASARLVGFSSAPGQTTASVSASDPEVVQTTYIGKPETGFAIWETNTLRRSSSVRGTSIEQVSTTETQVTELSAEALDSGLFEVPKKFQSVPRILPIPRPAVWARWLAQAHSWWVRFSRIKWLPHTKP